MQFHQEIEQGLNCSNQFDYFSIQLDEVIRYEENQAPVLRHLNEIKLAKIKTELTGNGGLPKSHKRRSNYK